AACCGAKLAPHGSDVQGRQQNNQPSSDSDPNCSGRPWQGNGDGDCKPIGQPGEKRAVKVGDTGSGHPANREACCGSPANIPEIAPSGKYGTNQAAIANGIRMPHSLTAFAALAILAVAAVLSASLIVVLGPWLARYAMAKPNARSSHKLPTPQGGGIAVVA